jgi:hypothetical protein
VFYEALKDVTEYGKQRWVSNPKWHVNNSFEGLVLGGLAGGMSFALPLILRSALAVHFFSVILIFIQIIKQVSVHILPLLWMSSKLGCKFRVQLLGINSFP